MTNVYDYNTLKSALGAAAQAHETSLDLSGMGITELPPNISSITSLESLDLSNNRLKHIPSEISELSKLKHLDLSDNELVTLPPAINRIIENCRIFLNSNPLIEIPSGVRDQGTRSVLTYLTRRWTSSESQWVSKVLVVGEGGVGKTCMINAMQSKPFDSQSDTTHGVAIKTLNILHPNQIDNPRVSMKLNCWDFGGQDIYHATHQFFYSDRALFIVAWNARLGYEQSKIYSWLERINLLAPESPVILVATKIDERRSLIPIDDLQKKYPQIKHSLYLSNKTGDGVKNLIQKISAVSSTLPLMGEKWPANWLTSAEKIRAMTSNHVTERTMFNVFRDDGVDDESKVVLARWLHDLGDILYYPEDADLNHRIFLNPQWVTENISSVLEHEGISDGVFKASHMSEVWGSHEIDLQQDLLKLMEKFDLSYNIVDPLQRDNAQCLVVELLPLDPPEYLDIWNSPTLLENSREVSITYTLNVDIPPGIPTWFIARSHRFTTNTHWRFGALFQDGPEKKNIALVETPPNSRTIRLSVRGESPYNLFVILRDGLDLTLLRYPGLEIIKTIPCITMADAKNCEHEFDESDVRRRLGKSLPTIECPKCDENIEVAALVFGINLFDQFKVVSMIDAEIAKKPHLWPSNIGSTSVDNRDADISAQILAIRELMQRQYTRQHNVDQGFIESHCPSVFSVRPTVNDGWLKTNLFKQEWELELYCEMPGQWHPVGESGVYRLEKPSEWLTTIIPHLAIFVKAMKLITPLVGPSLSYTQEVLAKTIEKDIELIESLVKALPNPRHDQQPEYLHEVPTQEKARGANLRKLRVLLEHLDSSRTWGNLEKRLTPEGHYFWLCEHHAHHIMHPNNTLSTPSDA